MGQEVGKVYGDGMEERVKGRVGQLEKEAAREIAKRWFHDAEEQAVTDLVDMIVKVVPGSHRQEAVDVTAFREINKKQAGM